MKKSVLSILFLFSVNFLFGMLDTPMLLSPQNGLSNQEPNVLLDWSAVTGANIYQCRIGTNPLLNNNQVNVLSSSSSQLNATNLAFGTIWYWQVRALKTSMPGDSSEWSAIRSFSTLNQLYLLSPQNNAAGNEPSVLLDWSGISGIVAYDYQWDTSASFSSPLVYLNSVSNNSQVNAFQLRFGTRYFWRVRTRHNADTSDWSEFRSFYTLNQLYLLTPQNNATGNEPSVLLDWSGISGIVAYDYQWDTSASFNSPLVYLNSVSNNSQVNAFQLRFGTRYFWRVRARHNADTSDWSEARSFTTIEYPTLLTPTNATSNVSLNPLLDWAGFSGITAYQYRFSSNQNFLNAAINTISASSQANLVNLLYGTTYFWQVRGCNASDTSHWSPAWSFTTLYQISPAPQLLSPANSAQNVPLSGTSLQWSNVATATFYEYQLDDVPNFSSPVNGTETVTSASFGNLSPSTTYYWKVRAGNNSGFSAWSETRSFTTETVTRVDEQQMAADKGIIFPNPSDGIFHFRASGFQDEKCSRADLYSVRGKFIRTLWSGKALSQIDLCNHGRGIYILEIHTQGKITREKIMVQ